MQKRRSPTRRMGPAMTSPRRFLAALTGAALAMVAGSAAAQQQCAPFVDVTGPTGVCPAVTWLRNRAITLGCDATHYCPNAAVPRLQMAAFMNRLGNVITPEVVSSEASGGTLVLLNENVLCKTALLPTRTYRRLTVGQGSLSFEVTGTQEFVVAVASSTDGTNWTLHGNVARAYVTPGARHHVQTISNTQPFDPDLAPRQYGLIVQRTGSGGLNDLSSWTCNLQVTACNAGAGAI